MIPHLVCESVSIRGIARILSISMTTVIGKIKLIAASIVKPPVPLNRKAFELDEVRTYIKKKENQYWIAYALCSETKEVVDFIVGKRSKRTLKMVVNTLLLSGVNTIKTDKLNIYQSLIPPNRHISAAYNINSIERNNLNLRTHLKRLSRRTICFSKNLAMLEACLKIYFWNNDLAGKKILQVTSRSPRFKQTITTAPFPFPDRSYSPSLFPHDRQIVSEDLNYLLSLP